VNRVAAEQKELVIATVRPRHVNEAGLPDDDAVLAAILARQLRRAQENPRAAAIARLGSTRTPRRTLR
jgi:hypothetical protein